jgi:cell division septum initiation protein DivIVA
MRIPQCGNFSDPGESGMLFDLQGSRKTAVKAIYLGLAILMAGGLILFGVGSSVNGGLADVFSNSSGSGDLKKQVEESQKAVAANPKSTQDLQNLIADRYALAGSEDNYNPDKQTFSKEGKAQLKELSNNWKTYQKLAGDKVNITTASYAVSAYLGLQDAKGAQKAQAIIAEKQPNAANYLALFQFALYAGDQLAATGAELKARDLATEDQKSEVNQQIKTLKKQMQQQNAQFQKQLQEQFAAQQKNNSGGAPSNPFSGAGGGNTAQGGGGNIQLK